MKKQSKFFTILTCIILVTSSCKKKQEDVQEIAQNTCVGGAGGNLTLIIRLQHHEHTLINLKNYRDTIYVKYNVQEFPGSEPSNYDATFIGDYPGDSVPLTNLKCGNYYLYAVGMESTHYDRVTGGIPYSTTTNEGSEYVTIPVTE